MKALTLLIMLVATCACENLYSNTKFAVITVTSKNFESQVTAKRNIGHVVLAHFYKSNDGRSNMFRDEFNAEAIKNKGIFHFVGIDCETDTSLCSKEDVRQFPAIRVYPPVPIPAQEPDYDLNLKKVLGHATGFVQSKVVEITDDNFQQKLGENPAVPKVLLFTDKTATPILYKALSLAFDVTLDLCRKN